MMPWNTSAFEGWSIIGMNHYGQGTLRYLFVAMGHTSGIFVKAEGPDEDAVFQALADRIARPGKLWSQCKEES